MSRYRKLDRRFWTDEKIRALRPVDKLIAIYLFAGQSNRIGCFPFSPGMASEDTGIPLATLVKRVREVCTTLGWSWDEAADVVFIPTWWRYNPPENQSVLIGNLKDLDDVPASPLVARFGEHLAHLAARLHDTLRQAFATRATHVSDTSKDTSPPTSATSEAVAEAVAGAGATTTSPSSPEGGGRSSGSPNGWGRPEHLVALYNRLAPPELPRVTRLSPARREKAKRYLREFPEEAFWRGVFGELAHSKLLRGLKRNQGHENFRGDFDWLLTKGKDGTENAVKVAEGKYRDRAARAEEDDE